MTALTEVRAKLAAVLVPIGDSDPDVQVEYVDAITPPTILVTWADPWLEPDTACFYASRPQLLLIAGRVEPGAGIAALETMVSDVVRRLGADTTAWPIQLVTSPRVFEIGGVSYLGVRVELALRVTVESPAPAP